MVSRSSIKTPVRALASTCVTPNRCLRMMPFLKSVDLMQNSDYAKNLRLLCDEYGTVSDVCRGIEINRQQFNKYLSGQITPNRHNRRRISEFFKVDDEHLNSSHEQFAQQLTRENHSVSEPSGLPGFFVQMTEALPNEVDKLRRYIGYYYQSFYSLGFEGYIIRSLVSVYEQDGIIRTKAIEHLSDEDHEFQDTYVFKYLGTMFYLSDRIFLLEYETLTKHALNLTILNTSHRSKITTLSGITTGVSSRATREPSACRTEWEFLGKQIDVRNALKSCRLYKPESDEVSDAVRERIDNHIDDDQYLLRSYME